MVTDARHPKLSAYILLIPRREIGSSEIKLEMPKRHAAIRARTHDFAWFFGYTTTLSVESLITELLPGRSTFFSDGGDYSIY